MPAVLLEKVVLRVMGRDFNPMILNDWQYIYIYLYIFILA